MKREHVLTAAFLMLGAALLVGQRLGFRFAGGDGYETPLVATPFATLSISPIEGTESVHRGETVRTDDRGTVLDLAGLGTVQIATHTELTLERLSSKEIVLRLGTGRITVTATTVPIDVRMDVVEADVARGGAVFENLPARRFAHVWLGTATVRAARRGEMRTPVLADATLFYDRADRETIDNPPKNP